MKPSGSKKSLKKEGYDCLYCKKVFVHEGGLLRHMCRIKKRNLARDQQEVRIGFVAYRTFYALNFRQKKPMEMDAFIASSVYDAFVKFGRYIIDTNVLEPEEFIRYAIQSKLPVDKWASDKLYGEYVRLLNRFETFDRATERTLLLAQKWANDEKKSYRDFFREISPSRALFWLTAGRISPWVIFNCETGRELIDKFSHEQLEIMQTMLDVPYWNLKFKENMNEVRLLREELKREGM